MRRKSIILISSLAVAIATLTLAVFTGNAERTSVVTENVDMGYYGATTWDVSYVGKAVLRGDAAVTADNVKSLPVVSSLLYSVSGKVSKYGTITGPEPTKPVGIPKSTNEYVFEKYILIDSENNSVEIENPINLRFIFGGKFYRTSDDIVAVLNDFTIYAVYRFNGVNIECIPAIDQIGNIGGGTFIGGGSIIYGSQMQMEKPIADSDYTIAGMKVVDSEGTTLEISKDNVKDKIVVHASKESTLHASPDGDTLNIWVPRSAKIYAIFRNTEYGKRHVITVRAFPEQAAHIRIEAGDEIAEGEGSATVPINESAMNPHTGSLLVRCTVERKKDADDKWYEYADDAGSAYKAGYWVESNNSIVEKLSIKCPTWAVKMNTMAYNNQIEMYISKDSLKNTDGPCVIVIPFEQEDKGTYKYAAITSCIPNDGGTAVAGIGSRPEAYGTQVVAYPNEGYDFDYWSWNEGGVSKTSKEKQMNVYIDGLKNYTAHFKKAVYKVSVVETKPFGGGYIDGEGYYNKTDDATIIKLHANEGYELESCNYVTSDGINHSISYGPGTDEADFEIPEIKEDIALHLSFRSLKYKVRTFAQADAIGCTSYIGTTESVGEDSEVEAKDGDKLFLKATPDSNHKFQYWKNTKGEVIKGTEVNGVFVAVITAAGADEYTAYFNNKTNQIQLTEYPEDAKIGTVSYNGEAPVTSQVYDAERGSNIILKAKVVDGNYAFSEWQITDPEGNQLPSNTSNPLNMPNYNPEKDGKYIYTAMFKPIQCLISANATPPELGTVTIGDGKSESVTEGSKTVDKGTELVLTAIPKSAPDGTYYVPDYWTDDAGNTYAGELDIVLTADSKYQITNRLKVKAVGDRKYTAHFIKSDCKITIQAEPSNQGLVSFNDNEYVTYGNYSATGTMSYTLNAKPVDARYKFVGWEWNETGVATTPETSTQLPLVMPKAEKDMTFTANFAPATYTVKAGAKCASPGYSLGLNMAYVVVNDETENPAKSDAMVNGGDKVVFAARYDAASAFEFKYWEDSSGKQIIGTTDVNGNNKIVVDEVFADTTYTAVYAPKTVKVTISATPKDAGTVKMTYGSSSVTTNDELKNVEVSCNSTIVLSQIPKEGYAFDHWEYKDPKTQQQMESTKDTLVFSEIYGDTSFKAVFRPSRHNVTINKSPDAAEWVWFVERAAEGNVESTSNPNVYKIDDGAKIHLVLRDSENYSVDALGVKVGADGTEQKRLVDDERFEYGPIKDDITITVYLSKKTGKLKVSSYPSEAGEVQYGNNSPVKSESYRISKEDNVTVKAIESNPEYKFARWEYIYPNVVVDGKPQHYTSTENPLNLLRIGDIWSKDDTQVECVAIFEKVQYTVDTKASPLDGGTLLIDGERAQQKVADGESVKLVAKPSEGYVLDYIKDSEGNKYQVKEYVYDEKSGVICATFNAPPIHADETYTGYFVKMEISVSAYSAPADAGVIDINGNGYSSATFYETFFFDTVTLTAKPKDGSKYKFERWEDDEGNRYTNNPLVISNIKKSINLAAVFVKEKEEQGFRVVASPPIGGFVSKVYNENGTATITADANTGYRFSCWKKGNTIIAKTPVAVVDDISAGTTYTAYFLKSAAYTERSDITKTHYYEEKRRRSQPVYVVTKDSLKKQVTTQILEDKSNYENSTPPLKSYAAVQHAKDYFARHKKGNDFVFLDGELFTTKGEQMPIKMVPSQEDVLAEAVDFSERKFGDRYDVEVLAVVDVTMPDGFAEGPRTYMWRNTGAQFKDNVYVMYMHDGKIDYHWSTAVLDMFDDMEQQYEVLRFSIPGTGRLDRIAAIRVKIKED